MRSLNCTIRRPNGDPLFLVPFADQTPEGEPSGPPIQQLNLASRLIIDTDPDGPNYCLMMDPKASGRAILKFPDCAPQGVGGWLEVWWPSLYARVRIVTPRGAQEEMGTFGGDSEILMWDYAHYA